MKRAQLSIEFILLGVMGFLFLFVVIGAILTLSADKTTQNAYDQLEDLGRSLQQEFLLASQVQDGYQRIIILPMTIQDMDYTIVLGNTSLTQGYMSIMFAHQEIYYPVPVINGSLVKGENLLVKQNNTLYLN